MWGKQMVQCMEEYSNEDKLKERATFLLAPIQPAYQPCVDFFFQRQFIFRYFKNSFESDFQTAAAALAPSVAAFPSIPVLPTVVQSPFLGSQHSFDLILNAICNPLQDTEACSPTCCTFSITFSIFFLYSLWAQPFFSYSLSAALLNYLAAPPPQSGRSCHHVILDTVITLLQLLRHYCWRSWKNT